MATEKSPSSAAPPSPKGWRRSIIIYHNNDQGLADHKRSTWSSSLTLQRGLRTTRTDLELLSALAGITMTRPPRQRKGFGTVCVFSCKKAYQAMHASQLQVFPNAADNQMQVGTRVLQGEPEMATDK